MNLTSAVTVKAKSDANPYKQIPEVYRGTIQSLERENLLSVTGSCREL